ncbi:AhpD family alkylhydroperoxidase [Bradyrhizobium elkanii]
MKGGVRRYTPVGGAALLWTVPIAKTEGRMQKDYADVCKHISNNLGQLRKGIPETMRAFSAMAQAATGNGALDARTKELIALALGVAAHCDGCIGFHAEALVKLGVGRKELEETLGLAIYMGGGPSLMYAADALGAYDLFQERAVVAEPAMD